MKFEHRTVSRRSLLQTGAAAVCAMAVPPAWSEYGNSETPFLSATDAARAIRRKEVSSLELTKWMLERIDRFDKPINSVIVINAEGALREAARADDDLARGHWRGPLHGVPFTAKDAFKTKGLLTTSGALELKNYVPDEDAPAVARLKKAGSVLLGKTNVSEWTGDWQSYNDVFGTTNNPWDKTRTPGGSTGGGAAALACGFTYLSLGSDMGGSIRIPSHFCGVYGHKPSLGVVPMRGHLPPPLKGMMPPPPHIAVAGPLARSANDLKTAMSVLGGPDGDEAVAYRWAAPPARGARLSDYRIGYVIDDVHCPVVDGVKDEMEKCIDALREAGAQVEEGWPEGVDAGAQFDLYLKTLYSFYIREKTPEQMEMYRGRAASDRNTIDEKRARAYLMSAAELQTMSDEQAKARAVWQKYFKTHDAFILPTSFIPAFPHDHRSPSELRKHVTPMGERNYRELLFWIGFATLTGLPATVAPVGFTPEGLPVGAQIIGPYLEDYTPIHIAGLLSDEIGGYQAPPGFA